MDLPGPADAGLSWWSDSLPAITRHRQGRGFVYIGPGGVPVRDRAVLRRIGSLAIPPAWADVRICPHERGHIQATGRDGRGRKQYRYHARWRAVREAAKFDRLVEFGEALPRIRDQVNRDLALPGMPRQKVLALVVRLLESTAARIGNEEYARSNGSFGLTTLQNRHARSEGGRIRLRFRGKSGRMHDIDVHGRRLAGLVRRCRELPGRELFEYVDDDGSVHSVRSDDVNDYLRSIAGPGVTAKMFRTWSATVLAADQLRAAAHPTAAIQVVAGHLGNTPAVARRAYVHPAVLDALTGARVAAAAPRAGRAVDGAASSGSLSAREAYTLALLRSARAASG